MNYGFKALRGIPEAMDPWRLKLQLPTPSEYGEYALIEVDQADIELHHQVEVIDESGAPLRGVWVIFGFPGGGPDIPLGARENYWWGAPSVLRGNAQKTNYAGYAQHTFQGGGEDIWVWDVDRSGVLRLPSPMVQNCAWVRTPVGQFDHTGVKLRFQRRQNGVVPKQQRLEELEARVKALELRLNSYAP